MEIICSCVGYFPFTPFTGLDNANSFFWPQKTNMTWSNSNEYIKFAVCKKLVQTCTYAINASLCCVDLLQILKLAYRNRRKQDQIPYALESLRRSENVPDFGFWVNPQTHDVLYNFSSI